MKKNVFSILIAGLLVASCCIAGCIFSSGSDPIVGTYVYTEDYEPPVITNPDIEHPVGDFRHIEDAIKVYENGTLLYSYYRDGRVEHHTHKWKKVEDGHYMFESGGLGDDTVIYYYDYYLSPDGNELTTLFASGRYKTYVRNDSYVIPEIWP